MIYTAKCLIRGKSPRDFVNLLISFKYQTNVVVVDMANKVAACGNRIVKKMFQPNECRVAKATEENQFTILSLEKFLGPSEPKSLDRCSIESLRP